MKKALALLLALVMVVAMAACGSKTTTPSTNAATTPAPAGNETEAQVEASELKVGVFYYTFADTYISSVRTALDAQLDSLGVTYNNFDGNNNQTTQNEQIQTAVTDGYNLLVVNMVTSGSPDVANEIISLANGTPVIFFNRAIEADGEEGTVLNANTNICFIGTDAPEAGHLQGKMVGEYLLANWDTVDLNGDGTIDENDRYYLGNAFPRYTLGFTYNVAWKGIDLSIFLQGVLKRDMMVRGELIEPFHFNYGYTMYEHQLDFWTPTNTDARWPRLTDISDPSNQNNYRMGSDLYMFDGSYLRLKNIQLGYTLPERISMKFGVKRFKIYFNAQNLLTFSNCSFIDPESSEFGSNMNSGGANSGRNYPNLRYFGAGLNITF